MPVPINETHVKLQYGHCKEQSKLVSIGIMAQEGDDVFKYNLPNLIRQGDPRAFDFCVCNGLDIKDVLKRRNPIRTDRFLKGFSKPSKPLRHLSRGASQDIQRSLFEAFTENSQGI